MLGVRRKWNGRVIIAPHYGKLTLVSGATRLHDLNVPRETRKWDIYQDRAFEMGA